MGRKKRNMKHKLELFSADCKLCEMTIDTLKRAIRKDQNLNLVVHKASECIDGSCCELAARYGVFAVPSLVVDKKLVKVGKIENIAEIQDYLK